MEEREKLEEELLYYLSNKHGITLISAAKLIDGCIKNVSNELKIDYNAIYNIIFVNDCIKPILYNKLNAVITKPINKPDNKPINKPITQTIQRDINPLLNQECTISVSDNKCARLKYDQCIESSTCFFLEPYGCLPRRIKDAEIINEDPDKYIVKNLGKIDDLKRMVHIASYLYYNYDGGGLTDNSFDALEYFLKKKEKLKGRAYEKIGAEPVEKIRTRLPFIIPSLNKVKPGTLALVNFLNLAENSIANTEIVASLKLDGVSGEVYYKKGKLHAIYTRGNGIIGGDVTYLKDYVRNIPLTLEEHTTYDFVVRGEFILSIEIYEEKYAGLYSNARSFVSAKINSGFVNSALTDIEFIAFKIRIDGLSVRIPKPSDTLKILDDEGFKIVDYEILKNPTTFQLIELYRERRKISPYLIDGLVLSINQEDIPATKITNEIYKNLGPVINPTNTVAFKMQLEEQLRITKVVNIDWRISRYGRYVPVAVYESVYIDGIRLHRATAHNAKHVREWNMGKGTIITVFRSGDVIPQIKKESVVKDMKIKAIYPKDIDEGGYDWEWKGSDIVLVDIEGNPDVHRKRILHFFQTIGIAGIGEKTVEKFYDAGMLTPEAVIRAQISDFLKIKGIGKKKANDFYNNIRSGMASVPPDRFIEASTTFQSGTGRKTFKELFRRLPNLLNMSSKEINDYFNKNKIKGLGPAKIKKIAEGIPEFRNYLNTFSKEDVDKAVNYYINKVKELQRDGVNKFINGRVFVKSGFMGKTDYELEDYIYDHNGTFTETVSEDIAAVIVGPALDSSKKITAALELGIPVLTIRELAHKFNIPLKRFENDNEENEDEENNFDE